MAAASGYLGAIGAGSIVLLWPQVAEAKPGGHRTQAGDCLSTFEIDYQGIKETETLYLAGSGYASFDNVYDYAGFDIRQVLTRNTVSMQWETNHCFAGNRPDWGIISGVARVRGKSDTRSGIVLISNSETSLFPATMVNTLFFDIEFPHIGLRMFNKDPIVLRGLTHNMTMQDVEQDVRVKAQRAGLSSSVEGILSRGGNDSFNPMGNHALQQTVDFYDANDPEKVVAILRDSQYRSFVHYGLDVQLVASTISGRFLTAEWQVKNLLWDYNHKPQQIVWYVDDSHDLKIVSVKLGNVTLKDKPYSIAVQAYNTNPTKRLSSEPTALDDPRGGLIDAACIFCGAQNTPASFDVKDFVSGFDYADATRLRKLAEHR